MPLRARTAEALERPLREVFRQTAHQVASARVALAHGHGHRRTRIERNTLLEAPAPRAPAVDPHVDVVVGPNVDASPLPGAPGHVASDVRVEGGIEGRLRIQVDVSRAKLRGVSGRRGECRGEEGEACDRQNQPASEQARAADLTNQHARNDIATWERGAPSCDPAGGGEGFRRRLRVGSLTMCSSWRRG